MSSQQSIENFIGRQKEIELFLQWLATPDEPWIFYIYDALAEPEKKGGVGKTWLLRRYVEFAQQAHEHIAVVMVDFFNLGDRDRIFLAERVVVGIQQLYPTWSPTSFTTVTQQYRASESDSEAPPAPVSSESSDIRIQEEMSAALADDLRRLDTLFAQEQKTLLVFFDTFERIEQNPDIAVLRQSQFFPDNYQFTNMRVVMAGRNALDWTHPNWQGREQEVKAVALPPFSQHEMLQYLDTASIYYGLHEQDTRAIALYERTEGRPIIIGLAIDVVNHRILTLEELLAVPQPEFESYLVPQINQLENPLNWVILLMAHVYHHLNISTLEWLLSQWSEPIMPITREELAKVLPGLSFVRQSSTGADFALHDEMRRLVNKYCWDVLDTDRLVRKDISRNAIHYYEQQIDNELKVPQQQDYIVDVLYHRLFVDLEDGLRYFIRHFESALFLIKNAFARLLLYELQKFTDDMSLALRNEVLYAEAALLRSEENPAPALNLLQRLKHEADPQWLADHLSVILTEEGWCYKQQSKLSAALDSFTRALEIARAEGRELYSARLLSNIGDIFQRRGQFSKALTYYEQSMAIYKKLGRERDYAVTLMNISIVYRRQGKLDEALLRCKVAWHIQLELFRKGAISEVQVGLNLNALGSIYQNMGNLVEAERCFQEAFDIFLRVNYKRGIAIIYNRLGQVQLLKGNLEGAQEWFLKAQEASREVEREQYVSSLNKQGRICALQQQWAEAIPLFEQAIVVARQLLDYYHLAANLIDLADALDHLEQKERALQLLQEAEAIAIQENYADLWGQLEEKRGAMAYSAKEYKQAFQHFIQYCHHMAEYNSLEFNTAMHRVVDALLSIPREIAPMILQEMLTYWLTQQLDKSYPELIPALNEVEGLMTL